MESIFLFVIVIVEAIVIFFQNKALKEISEESMDRLSQKNVGIYYPKEAKSAALKDDDRVDTIPLEDISDEDFLKAVRKEASPDGK